MTLVPYLLVAAYQLKLSLGGQEGHDAAAHARMRWIAGIATIYAIAMLLAGGSRYLLLSSLLYVPGSLLFWAWQRHRGVAFRPVEMGVMLMLCAMAVMAVVGLGSGWLRL
jgi:arginine:ornithine antiporter/lysine permease